MPSPKNRFKKSFFFLELQELEVRICVQPNFSIITLILLNRFHKFQRSRELNSSEGYPSFHPLPLFALQLISPFQQRSILRSNNIHRHTCYCLSSVKQFKQVNSVQRGTTSISDGIFHNVQICKMIFVSKKPIICYQTCK